VQCNSDEWRPLFGGLLSVTYPITFWYAWLMMLIYPVGVPALFFLTLRLREHYLYDKVWNEDDEKYDLVINKTFEDQYGFLYASYVPQFYYWETIELIKKVFFVGVMVFIEPDTAMQLVVGAVAAVLMTLLYSSARPYVEHDDNTLQLVCQFTVFMTYFMGVLLLVNIQLQDVEGADAGTADRLTPILILCNAIPLVLVIGSVFKVAVLPVLFLLWKLKSTYDTNSRALNSSETQLAKILMTSAVSWHKSLRVRLVSALNVPTSQSMGESSLGRSRGTLVRMLLIRPSHSRRLLH
jgi:hypothetical protein